MFKSLRLMVVILLMTVINSNLFSQVTAVKNGDWGMKGTWSGNNVPGSTDSVVIADGYTVKLNTSATVKSLTIGQGGLSASALNFDNNARTLTVSNGITINSNGTLQMTSGKTQSVTLSGDFTNNGTFTAGSGNSFNFTGTGNPKGIYGADINFYNLTINSSAGVFLETDINVNGTFTLSSGLFKLKQYTAALNGSISISSPGSSKMIVLDDGTYFGTLKYKIASNTAYTFPVGDTRGATEYSPVTVTFTSGTNSSSVLALSMRNLKDSNNTSVTNYLKRSWIFTQTGLTSFAYNISMNYLTADVVGSESNLYFGKYSNGIWMLLGRPYTGTNTFFASGLTSFSTFTAGEQGALPVHLSSLNGTADGRNVMLRWATSSETNNAGFEILRAAVDKYGNASEYISAGQVAGKGNSNQQNSYNFTDRNLNTGKYRYKLKQIDFNGNFEYFELNNDITVGVPAKLNLGQNYPNPFNPSTKINYDLPSESSVTLSVYDMSGREVVKLLNGIKQNAGYHTAEFNASSLSSGIYFYTLSAYGSKITKQMVLVK